MAATGEFNAEGAHFRKNCPKISGFGVSYRTFPHEFGRYPISQAVVALNMRRTRYRGREKTHLQHVATAVAINLQRLHNWWNELPLAQTQTSRFVRLMAA
jgi:hypothetical protein